MLKFRGQQITTSNSVITGYEEVIQRYRGQERVLRIPVYGAKPSAPVSPALRTLNQLFQAVTTSGLGMSVEIIDTFTYAKTTYYVGRLNSGKRLLLQSQAQLSIGKQVFAKILLPKEPLEFCDGVAEPYAFALK